MLHFSRINFSFRAVCALWYLLLWLIAAPRIVCAQPDTRSSEADSLAAILPSISEKDKPELILKIAGNYRGENDRKRALHFLRYGLSVSEKIGDKNWQTLFYREIGRMHRAATLYDSALFCFEKSLALATETKHLVHLSLSNNEVGLVYQQRGDLTKALRYYLEALKAAEEASDESLLATTYNNIGFIYKGEEDYERALEYFRKNLAIRKKLNDQVNKAGALNNIGITLMAQEKYPAARAYYDSALLLLDSGKNMREYAMLYNNLGVTYENEGHHDLASAYYFKSIAIKEKLGDKRGIASTYGNIGANFRKARCWEEAIHYSGLSLALAAESDALELMLTASQNLAIVYENKKDYRNAFLYHKKFKEFQDSIFNENKAEEIAQMMAGYETEKKERENELLKKDAALKEATLKNQRYTALSVVLALTALLAFSVIVHLRHRKKTEIENLQLGMKVQIAHAEAERSRAELVHAREQLLDFTGRLLENSKIIEELKAQLQEPALKTEGEERIVRLNALLQTRLLTDEDWERFRRLFEKVHPGFFAMLNDSFEKLTPAEVRLMALLRLNLGTKDIAMMLGVSTQTVYKTRQRLKARIGNSPEDLLHDLKPIQATGSAHPEL